MKLSSPQHRAVEELRKKERQDETQFTTAQSSGRAQEKGKTG